MDLLSREHLSNELMSERDVRLLGSTTEGMTSIIGMRPECPLDPK